MLQEFLNLSLIFKNMEGDRVQEIHAEFPWTRGISFVFFWSLETILNVNYTKIMSWATVEIEGIE